MSISAFVEGAGSRDLSLVVVNRESPRPFQRLLEGVFEGQSVTVEEADVDDDVANVVYLLEEGALLATSSLQELQRSILMVNSDIHVTGLRDVEDVDPPEVIHRLEDLQFRLRGYPESNKEKLLLITMSRFIERLSIESNGGKHRASFQRLSRIDDEQGTRTVYQRLARTNTDVHVYGIPDWTPRRGFDVTMHGGWSSDFRESWFVVHVPDDESAPHGALVAVEDEPRVWSGFWTYDPESVREINRYVEREL
jgi:hypothetical protein